MEFTTDYKSILERLENIDAVNYAASRNYIDGAVTYLSPYISRGVISLPFVKEQILKKIFLPPRRKIITGTSLEGILAKSLATCRR